MSFESMIALNIFYVFKNKYIIIFQEQAVLSDPEILRKLNNSLSIFSDAMSLARQKAPGASKIGQNSESQIGIAKNETETEINQNSF